MVAELLHAAARALFFVGVSAMVAAVFFSPFVLFWRRRHLHPADRPPRRVPDAICWINAAIGMYLLHSLWWIFLHP